MKFEVNLIRFIGSLTIVNANMKHLKISVKKHIFYFRRRYLCCNKNTIPNQLLFNTATNEHLPRVIGAKCGTSPGHSITCNTWRRITKLGHILKLNTFSEYS